MNLGEMIARVRWDLDDSFMRAIPRQLIISLLNEANRLFQQETECNRTHTTFPFDYSATEAWKIALDASYLYVVAVTVDGRFLKEMHSDDIDRIAGGDTDNLTEEDPKYYLFWNGQLQLWPHPTSDYDGKDVILWTVRATSNLTDNDDVPEIPEAYHSGLCDYASWKLTRNRGVAQTCEVRFRQTLGALKRYVDVNLPPTRPMEIG